MKKFYVIFLTIDLVLIDQLIKWLVIKYYPYLVFENYGILFGFIKNSIITYALLTFGVLVLIWLIIKEKKKIFNFFQVFPIILISAGAISNIIDRIARGYVVDYISFIGLNTFNIADVFIIMGVLLYAYQIIKPGVK